MSHLDGRWRRQSLVYFGKPLDSSANVAVGRCLPGGMRVSSRAATAKYLVSVDAYDELRICDVVYCIFFKGRIFKLELKKGLYLGSRILG